MGKFEDLTGMKFGKYTVIERAEDKMSFDKKRGKYKPIIMWRCRCECGTENVIMGGALKSGRTKGCKYCCRPSNYVDLVGQRFGRLTVICEAGKAKNRGELLWHCECDCGGNATVLTSNLKRGNTKSCGCYEQELKEERAKVAHDKAVEKKERKRKEKQLHAEADRERKFVDKFNERYGHAFEYIKGYKSHDVKQPITVRCMVCGETKQRTRSKLFNADVNIACSNCNNNRKGMTKARCKECSKEFDCYSPLQTLCKECHSKAERAKNNVRARIREVRKKANGAIDYSVTLSRLIKRDNGICQLCGRKVNEADYVYINDAFSAGNDYPSIDHIKPLSKGGVHQWSNVQLAHRICNSIKCDSFDD